MVEWKLAWGGVLVGVVDCTTEETVLSAGKLTNGLSVAGLALVWVSWASG